MRYVQRSCTEPLPDCDAVAACIALHHVKDMATKGGIYRNIFAALRPGGIFVNADTTVGTAPKLRHHAFQGWAKSMAAHGIDEPQAFAHFASWAHEDFYPPLITELRLLAEAGFAEPGCFWREAAAAGFGAMKHGLRERKAARHASGGNSPRLGGPLLPDLNFPSARRCRTAAPCRRAAPAGPLHPP